MNMLNAVNILWCAVINIRPHLTQQKGKPMNTFSLTAAAMAMSAIGTASWCEATQLDQTGYFKSAENDRIIAYHSTEKLTYEHAQDIANEQFFTQGRVGRIAFYSGQENAAPRDELTLSSGLQPALIVLSNPPYDTWDWLFMQHPSGETELREN